MKYLSYCEKSFDNKILTQVTINDMLAVSLNLMKCLGHPVTKVFMTGLPKGDKYRKLSEPRQEVPSDESAAAQLCARTCLILMHNLNIIWSGSTVLPFSTTKFFSGPILIIFLCINLSCKSLQLNLFPISEMFMKSTLYLKH